VTVPRGAGAVRLTGSRATARFADGAPAIAVNDRGAGKTVYLNFSLHEYSQVKLGGVGGEEAVVARANEQKRAALETVMAGLLELAEVKPQVTVTLADTGRNFGGETIRRRNGTAEYVGILRQDDVGMITDKDRRKVSIRFPRQAHAYDVVNKIYHGATDRIETTLTDGKAALFALLPNKVEGVSLRLPEAARAGDAVRAEARVRGPDSGVVILSARDPAGKERYRRKLTLVDGAATGVLPLALNDPPGKWTVALLDVVSNQKAEAPLTVTATAAAK